MIFMVILENTMYLCMDATISANQRKQEYFHIFSLKLANFLASTALDLEIRNQKKQLHVLHCLKNFNRFQMCLQWRAPSLEWIMY